MQRVRDGISRRNLIKRLLRLDMERDNNKRETEWPAKSLKGRTSTQNNLRDAKTTRASMLVRNNIGVERREEKKKRKREKEKREEEKK